MPMVSQSNQVRTAPPLTRNDFASILLNSNRLLSLIATQAVVRQQSRPNLVVRIIDTLSEAVFVENIGQAP